MFKSSMSVSRYSIARFLNFCSQNQETESFDEAYLAETT